MKEERYNIYCRMIERLDEGCSLINEYDSYPHQYGEAVMYQAESQMIHTIGKYPKITVTELASMHGKTPSACSQLIRRLRMKGWVTQVRNEENNREYNLILTEAGQAIYKSHAEFEEYCYHRSFHNLDEFSEKELLTYIAIQEKLNETFRMDVEESMDKSI